MNPSSLRLIKALGNTKGNINTFEWAKEARKTLGPAPNAVAYHAHMDQLAEWFKEINHNATESEDIADKRAAAFITRLANVMVTLVDRNMVIPKS